MTREEMVDNLGEVPVSDTFGTQAEYEAHRDVLEAAAAELRKSCATCRWFQPDAKIHVGWCMDRGKEAKIRVPFDGSSYSRPGWEAK